MGLETGTYISSLNASNPVTGDNKTEGDDHLRLIKATLLATFPNVTGAVTATHTALNTAASLAFGAPISATNGTFTGQVTSNTGQISAFGLAGNNNRGVFYANSNATQYLQNTNDAWNVTGSFTAAGLLKGNGGGSGLGAITVSTSAPSGGAAGDIWIQY